MKRSVEDMHVIERITCYNTSLAVCHSVHDCDLFEHLLLLSAGNEDVHAVVQQLSDTRE